MNETLQKRIEEAKKKTIQEYVESFKYENGMELEPAIKIFLEKIGTTFFEYGISFALQNQWISIDKNLPPLDEVSSNSSIGVIACTSEGVIRYAYYHHYLHEWFSAETSTRIDNVTKWMFVPEKGGDE